MISREELRQLASFECRHPGELAISFYFKPTTPQDKSHREEAILAKDLVRKTLQELSVNADGRDATNDLERILQLAERMHGNQARSKAVFACHARGIWQEFDVPAVAPSTKLYVNRRFHLKPLAPVFSDYPRLWIALIDRQNARFLELQFEQIRENGSLNSSLTRHGRSDGYAGYDAGHTQRHEEDEARRHFYAVAEFLKNGAEKKQFEALVIGCHDVNWPDLEAQLHPYVKKKLLGRFSADLGTLTDAQAKQQAERILHQSLEKYHQELVREAVDGAKSNGLGVTGLRRVLRATEMGEVETLLMTNDYTARAVECTSCGHIDSHLVPYCPLCGRATRVLIDVCEALVPVAIKNNIGLVLVPRDEKFDSIGNIAALLRFRADRNTNQMQAAS
ncbi:MAG TPA: host attachment protein [Terriglobales bacterium]|nr:host attachment protein [Terriglobales bacterium]